MSQVVLSARNVSARRPAKYTDAVVTHNSETLTSGDKNRPDAVYRRDATRLSDSHHAAPLPAVVNTLFEPHYDQVL